MAPSGLTVVVLRVQRPLVSPPPSERSLASSEVDRLLLLVQAAGRRIRLLVPVDPRVAGDPHTKSKVRPGAAQSSSASHTLTQMW